jgi:hypothetical protein
VQCSAVQQSLIPGLIAAMAVLCIRVSVSVHLTATATHACTQEVEEYQHCLNRALGLAIPSSHPAMAKQVSSRRCIGGHAALYAAAVGV